MLNIYYKKRILISLSFKFSNIYQAFIKCPDFLKNNSKYLVNDAPGGVGYIKNE